MFNCLTRKIWVLPLALALSSAGAPAMATTASTGSPYVKINMNVLFIYDSSGSMDNKLGGKTKSDAAKDLMNEVMKELPPDASLGLIAFGHRRKDDCKDIEVMSPLVSKNAEEIKKAVNALKPIGKTPLSDTLATAAEILKDAKGAKMIVLLTDGGDECQGDPCEVARKLAESGTVVRVNTVGISPSDKSSGQLECIAREGGGRYFKIWDKRSLFSTLSDIREETIAFVEESKPVETEVKAPDDINLLLPSSGGKIIAKGYGSWENTVSGKEGDSVWTGPGQEVVFAFKDYKAARFSKFEIAIPGTLAQNVKEFELLASGGGNYHSIGKFTTKNSRQPSLYQEFTFPEVRARYLKLKILSNYGHPMEGWGSTQVFQIRLMGSL